MPNLIRIYIKTKLIRFGIAVYLVLFEYLIMEGRLIMSEINSIDVEEDQFAYRYDTQLLIDRRDEDFDEDEISDYITEHFEGNCLIAVGDEDLIKIHFHTNEPWKVLEYCRARITRIINIQKSEMRLRFRFLFLRIHIFSFEPYKFFYVYI